MRTSWIFAIAFFLTCNAWADQNDVIKNDRQAIADAVALGDTSKIITAKEQLSDDLSMEENQRRRDVEGVTIPLVPDGQGHLLADVVINGSTHASLVVDTGSPVVMLTASFAKALGLDLTKANTGYVEVLNGKYRAAGVSLDNVQVGDAMAHDIDATVLLQDSGKEISDGLLGMSFLSKFHFTFDQAGQKLTLRKM